MRLIIANKLYSSWSLRPWLVMRALDIPFDEEVIPLHTPQTKDKIAAVSPSGKVPVLIDGDIHVWESLAIIEHLAGKYPGKAIWPADAAARARARSIANEMHGGFMAVRQALPMNLGKRFKTPELNEDAKAGIARIEEIWRTTRARFGQPDGAGFLFGAFNAADAMYAPVVTRLDTYQIPVAADTQSYMQSVLAYPPFQAWRSAALAEPWTISEYEAGHQAVETYR
ncbi:MAG TPA: glutathione S-transferase family protein [Hyphomicrobium sp.]|nr:glutathione S-transferase family protein [Hyphomicrobium sp.]